jgi:hypothetical protein
MRRLELEGDDERTQRLNVVSNMIRLLCERKLSYRVTMAGHRE